MGRKVDQNRVTVEGPCPNCDNPTLAAYPIPGTPRMPAYCPKSWGGCGASHWYSPAVGVIPRRGSERPCIRCNETFLAVGNYLTCEVCRGTRQNNHTRIGVKACDHEACGTLFVYRDLGPNRLPRRFCSQACQKLWHAKAAAMRRKANGDKPKRHTPRDKALAIAYAYAYKCQICGGLIDLSRKAPHRESLAIDHITPQADNGTNDHANLRPTHFGCNSKRGHRGAAQLQAFGAL